MLDFSTLFSDPVTIVALIGLLIVLIALIKVRNIKLTTRKIVHVGLAVALTVVLGQIKFLQFPMGGSATLASMVPIIFISLVYGVELGMLTGFLYGIINFILGPWIVHPIQVLFDYPLPFMMIGLAGLVTIDKQYKTIYAVLIAFTGRFIFHFLSGLIFFGEYGAEYGLSGAAYSFLYNISYIAVDAIICAIVLYFLPIKRIRKALNL